jgi:hypothetical protein
MTPTRRQVGVMPPSATAMTDAGGSEPVPVWVKRWLAADLDVCQYKVA